MSSSFPPPLIDPKPLNPDVIRERCRTSPDEIYHIRAKIYIGKMYDLCPDPKNQIRVANFDEEHRNGGFSSVETFYMSEEQYEDPYFLHY